MLGNLLRHWWAHRPTGPKRVAPASMPEGPQDARDTLAEGIEDQNSGQFDRAESAYRRVLRSHPEHLEALHLLGNLLRQQGKVGETIATLQTIAGLSPGSAEAHFDLANAYAAGEDFAGAVIGYRKVVELDPLMAVAHNNLGNAYTILGRLEQAVDAYRTALRLDPQSAKALNNL